MTIPEAWRNVQAAAGPIRERYTRERPEWLYADSPLKYVDDRAMPHTFAKAALLAERLGLPGRAFEIGPGACYLLYILRDVYRWQVEGCDVPERTMYRDCAAALGITSVADWAVRPGERIGALRGHYDAIVGTQVSWLNAHTDADAAAFVADCREHLTDYGVLLLYLNPQAFGGRDHAAALAPFHPRRMPLPFLGDGFIIGKVNA